MRDCPRADDVILCASELAANAALHSRSRLPGGTFTVRATVSPGRFIRIEVEDSGGPWTGDTSDPTGHHGWDIIRAVANGWGIEGDRTPALSGYGSIGLISRNQAALHATTAVHGGLAALPGSN